MRGAPGLLAVALAVMLAACAQPVITDTPPSVASTPAALELEDEPPSQAEAVPTAKDRAPPVSGKHAAARARRASSYGLASYYNHRHARTASGEQFDARAMTAAHPTLPFGTRVRLTEVATGRSVTVRINDRGPFIPGRIVDISKAAAEKLGMIRRGVARVQLDILDDTALDEQPENPAARSKSASALSF
jgi:rare lipoprotein A